FLSSSTVESFYDALGGDLSLVNGKKMVSIGPVTSATMKKLGFTVDLEAKVYDIDGVIAAIKGE
ncbi:MAG: uroporphyrinogen-III synthase, partial [Cetobacterium sp.]